jgi:hypothetical protein
MRLILIIFLLLLAETVLSSTFVIQVGRQYVTRDGHKVRIYAVDGTKPYNIHGAIMADQSKWFGWQAEQWTADGNYLNGVDGLLALDIVSEEGQK